MLRFLVPLALFAVLATILHPETPQAPDDAGQTVLDRDREFVEGSKVVLSEITPIQVSNLSTLARVWGFLKYHHPKVTSGQLHWDFELFRILPAILGAGDRATANAILLRWVDSLGPVPAKVLEEPEAAALHLHPDLSWLGDEALVGRELSERLQAIRATPRPELAQFYVSLVPEVMNPVFEHELSYARINSPDAGYQLLGLFRYWNIIRYWFPYRDLIDDDWDTVLREFIPRVGLAKSAEAYHLELMAIIAKIRDTHAGVWSPTDVRPPAGEGWIPVTIRFVEDRPVVDKVFPKDGLAISALQRGDVICAIDDVPVEELIAKMSPYYAASNAAARHREIAKWMRRGKVGAVKMLVQRGRNTAVVNATRIPEEDAPAAMGNSKTNDLPGPTFRLLTKNVAYLKLSSVKTADVTYYLQQAAATKGWIIDIRDYPAEGVAFTLGAHLVDRPVEFARPVVGSLRQPGAFVFSAAVSLRPQSPHYSGRVVILVDEGTQSAGEFTAMALRVAPGSMVVGSTTAGADGNISAIALPGGLQTAISGIGVFYPDKRPTQRVGIIPDVVVNPTLAGIRAGRDEVLEEALRLILGPQTSPVERRRLAQPSD